MNDLMTKSFVGYVELKKQDRDLELGHTDEEDDHDLSRFFQQVQLIKDDMEGIAHLLLDLQSLNQQTLSTCSAKILRGLRDRMDSDMLSVLRKTRTVKARLDALDKSNADSRQIHGEGSAVDRSRMSTCNGLRAKLKEIMDGFHGLREKIMADYKEGLRRRYFGAVGEYPSEEAVESMVWGNGKNLEMENRERHEGVMEIWRSLSKLHEVFLDMAVLVETQGEELNEIERNVATAGSFISGGTDALFYAKQMEEEDRGWMCWVLALGFIIILVSVVAMLTN